jgi:hypothetical protein
MMHFTGRQGTQLYALNVPAPLGYPLFPPKKDGRTKMIWVAASAFVLAAE